MMENSVEATNFQYVTPQESGSKKVTTIFLNNVNSYLGSALVHKILDDASEDSQIELNKENVYKIYGTRKTTEDCGEIPEEVEVLQPGDDSFFNFITSCDFIIYDISEDFSSAKQFLKYFEAQLEGSRINNRKHLILISTIMTWAQTSQQGDVFTDLNYRKRRPHPCYANHLILERDVINLSKKYKNLVSSVVVCPGLVYGDRQDIFHFIYKKCYFNNIQVDIFAPGTNHLPLIYLEDFSRIMMMIIRNFPDPSFPYILAVQPESLPVMKIVKNLCEAAGGPETRIRICQRDEIFLMNEELMTVRKKIQAFLGVNSPHCVIHSSSISLNFLAAKSLQSSHTQPSVGIRVFENFRLRDDRLQSRAQCQ